MNAKELGSMPAHPAVGMDHRNGQSFVAVFNGGMTKREAFAMAAMQGWLASYGPYNAHPATRGYGSPIAEQSVAMADAMLAELAKETP